MYEYAISRGEGALIEYGILSCYALLLTLEDLLDGESIIIQECEEDCVTGV